MNISKSKKQKTKKGGATGTHSCDHQESTTEDEQNVEHGEDLLLGRLRHEVATIVVKPHASGDNDTQKGTKQGSDETDETTKHGDGAVGYNVWVSRDVWM